MGGIDPLTGMIIDKHHPLHGSCVTGTVLALPSGRGSCSGSGVMLELLVNGHAPAALVFEHPEPILTLGVVIGAECSGWGFPYCELGTEDFATAPGDDAGSSASATTPWSKTDQIAAPESFRLPELDLSDFARRRKTCRPCPVPAAKRPGRRAHGRPCGAVGGGPELLDVELRPHRRLLLPGPGESALRRATAGAGWDGFGSRPR